MRVWDIEANVLCNNHLLGEHREIHAIWTILTENKKGYSHHPETLRWRGKLLALYNRHEAVASQMRERGFNHKSALKKELATGSNMQMVFVDQLDKQQMILRSKGCKCLTCRS
ncbi:MAG: pyrimidine dimer DNA glycosylase/endonuclease V [Thermoproteota archaeon]|nr:pyrimidine dimer DNA glycosylase/endonuclease V [Thermoproteota archaeon]